MGNRAVIRISDRALGLLPQGRRLSGAILSVFNKSCNILLDNKHIVSLHGDDIFFTPLSLLIAGPFSFRQHLNAGDAVLWDGDPRRLYCGEWIFDVQHAQPVSCFYKYRPGKTALSTWKILQEASLPFLPVEIDDFDRAVYGRCRREIAAFYAQVISGDPKMALEAAGNILGIGSGLTPSGDDMLCGFCAAARLYEPFRTGLFPMEGCIAELALRSTVRESAEFVLCMLEMSYMPLLSRLLDSALTGDAAGAAVSAELISQIGSSSGRDYLFGIYLASLSHISAGREEL